MIVQIYGVTTPEDAAAVCALRPDHVGVVLDEGIETWDSVDRATARAMVAELKNYVTVVALSLSTELTRIRRTVEELDADIVHLARAAGRLAPDVIASLREMIAPTQVMTTVPVLGPESLATAKTLEASSDYLLLDTAHPETGVVGATGCVHDWAVSSAIVQAATTPVVLAGGLGPHNVADAIRLVKPSGVDSETRTSRADDRRRKDLDAVQRFIETARTVESSQ